MIKSPLNSFSSINYKPTQSNQRPISDDEANHQKRNVSYLFYVHEKIIASVFLFFDSRERRMISRNAKQEHENPSIAHWRVGVQQIVMG